MSLTLLTGHCLDMLPTLPAESVQCVVTSPPYFGLRSYNTPPQVWGGAAACVHTWVAAGTRRHAPKRDHAGRDFGPTRNQEPARVGASGVLPMGATCSGCGAWSGELGQEPTLALYITHLVSVFAAVRRVLHPTGVLWVNLGDSYSGSPASGGVRHPRPQDKAASPHQRTPRGGWKAPELGEKQLLMVPARFALAMQDAGWVLRQEIVWEKPNAMPESVKDRCSRSHEMLYMFAQRPRYYYNAAAIAEPSVSTHGSGNGYKRPERLSFVDGDGTSRESDKPWEPTERRNRRDVWSIVTAPYPEAHFATFPPALVRPCILAGSRPGDTVLDPFSGSGTVAQVADILGRSAIGIDLQPAYVTLAEQRTAVLQPELLLDTA